MKLDLSSNEDAGISASQSTEPIRQELSPLKEQLKVKRRFRFRIGSAEPASSAVVPNSVSERRRWAPTWRRVLGAAALLVVCGLTGIVWIYAHFSAAALKCDLGDLKRLSEGTQLVDRNGRFVGTVLSQDRKFVKMADVPGQLTDALIATEDSRFYEHHGIDVKAILRAAMANVTRMSVRQGGSTITQQLARQAFELKGRTLHRKLLEAFIARRLEHAFSKPQILEFYLNQIYLGSSYYGIGAAARGYFGKEVKDLTLEESAMIVGIIKAPVTSSPYRSLEAAKRVRDTTLDRMAFLGMIDADAVDAAKAKPVKVLSDEQRADRPEYLVAAVEREMDMRNDGEHPNQVALTVDIVLQSRLLDALKKHVDRVEKIFASAVGAPAQAPELQAAVVVLNNSSGEILATIGGRDYRKSPFDRALQAQRPAGTAFLPLTYAAIFSASPDLATSLVLDGPLDNRRAMIGGIEGILGEWGTETQTNVYEGQISAPHALYRGRTGATMRLGYQAGLDSVKGVLDKCGLGSRLRDQPSLLLGSSEVRLIDLARAYAAIIRGGKLPPSPGLARGVLKAKQALPGDTMVFQEPAALLVRSTLVAVVQRPEIQDVLRGYGLAGKGLAGYGGTAYGFTDAWFVGSNQDVTCAVWMGYDVARSIGKGGTSLKTALPFWAEAMAAATGDGGKGWRVGDGELALGLPSGPPDAASKQLGRSSGPMAAGGVEGVRAAAPVLIGPDIYHSLEATLPATGVDR